MTDSRRKTWVSSRYPPKEPFPESLGEKERVSGYTKKNGTKVEGYERRRPTKHR